MNFDFAYFAFIPIGILLCIYLVIETIEKTLHRFFFNKKLIYVWSLIITSILVLLIVILAFFIKI